MQNKINYTNFISAATKYFKVPEGARFETKSEGGRFLLSARRRVKRTAPDTVRADYRAVNYFQITYVWVSGEYIFSELLSCRRSVCAHYCSGSVLFYILRMKFITTYTPAATVSSDLRMAIFPECLFSEYVNGLSVNLYCKLWYTSGGFLY